MAPPKKKRYGPTKERRTYQDETPMHHLKKVRAFLLIIINQKATLLFSIDEVLCYTTDIARNIII